MERLPLLWQHTKDLPSESQRASPGPPAGRSADHAVLQVSLAAAINHTDEHVARMQALQQDHLSLLVERAKLQTGSHLPAISTGSHSSSERRYGKLSALAELALCRSSNAWRIVGDLWEPAGQDSSLTQTAEDRGQHLRLERCFKLRSFRCLRPVAGITSFNPQCRES